MSRTITNLFVEQTLVFDCKNLDTRKIVIPKNNYIVEDYKFGLLTLKATTSSLTTKKLEIIFQIDCSGSMGDNCSDGRTKMQHILHTIRNMILFFKENKELNVNITIHAFDDSIYKIVDHTPVNEDTYQKIITSINLIQPKGATNIEKALTDTKIIANELKELYPESIIHHILMTDGCATAGSSSYELLKSLVDNTYENAFIGFGINHDAALINAIGNSNNKSSNYFIDQLENAGLVYGEILHGFVYKLLENVKISVVNGLIYDFKTNTWNTKINVNNIVSDSLKFYHIISNAPESCEININQEKVCGESIFSENLIKYIYRQRTQEILYRVNDYLEKTNTEINPRCFLKLANYNQQNNEYIEEKNNLKQELNDLFEELKQYMQDNNLNEDILLKNLCDDIYICHRTIGTQYGIMYCAARMTSQGNQRTYTATKIPKEEINIEFNPANVIKRCNGGYYDNFKGEEEEIQPILLSHEVSNSLATPYRTPSNIRVMQEVTKSYEEKEESVDL
jgi:uncharacterized protein YegL